MPLQLDDLAALDAPGPTPNGQPLLLPVEDIDEDPEQPRREFDANALQELADTIHQRGVRQAISVRPKLQVGGITTFATGTPFSPSFTATLQGAPSGRPDVVGDWRVDSPDITRWFNASAFALPAPYTFGNAGKNTLVGPGLITVDVSVYKNFTFAERVNLQFRSEFFNLPNHANFANPAANISFPGQVGRITGTATANRVIQFGLRLTF